MESHKLASNTQTIFVTLHRIPPRSHTLSSLKVDLDPELLILAFILSKSLNGYTALASMEQIINIHSACAFNEMPGKVYFSQ